MWPQTQRVLELPFAGQALEQYGARLSVSGGRGFAAVSCGARVVVVDLDAAEDEEDDEEENEEEEEGEGGDGDAHGSRLSEEDQ